MESVQGPEDGLTTAFDFLANRVPLYEHRGDEDAQK